MVTAAMRPDLADAPERARLRSALASTFAAQREEYVAYAAALLGGRREAAEDVVQNAVLDILRRIDADNAAFLADEPHLAIRRSCWWSARKLYRQLRRVQPRDGADLPETASGDEWRRTEARLAMGPILDALPPSMRQVLLLRYGADLADSQSARVLGISVKAFRCRCDRALAVARRCAVELGVSAAAVALALWRRALRRLAATAVANDASPVAAVSSLALIGATGLALIGGATGGQVPVARHPSAVAGPGAGAGIAVTPVARETATPMALGSLPRAGLARRTAPAPPGSSATPPLIPGTAAHETIGDTSVASAAAARPDSGSGALVVFGAGRSCGCAVVLRSTDMGAGWQPEAAPDNSSGTLQRVVLPAAYPRDPRILLTTSLANPGPSYVAPRFGDAFVPLALPPGQAVLSRTFDSGDQLVFVATSRTLESVDLGTPVPRSLSFDEPVLAILAAGTAAADAGGALVDVVAQYATPAAPGHSATALFACSAVLCSRLGDVEAGSPTVSQGVTLAGQDGSLGPGRVAVATGCGLSVSTDGGRTFAAVPLPAPITCASQIAAGGTTTPDALWVMGWYGSNAADRILSDYDIAASSWSTVMQSGPTANWPVAAVPVGSHLLLTFDLGGVLCSGDAGRSWAGTCSG